MQIWLNVCCFFRMTWCAIIVYVLLCTTVKAFWRVNIHTSNGWFFTSDTRWMILEKNKNPWIENIYSRIQTNILRTISYRIKQIHIFQMDAVFFVTFVTHLFYSAFLFNSNKPRRKNHMYIKYGKCVDPLLFRFCIWIMALERKKEWRKEEKKKRSRKFMGISIKWFMQILSLFLPHSKSCENAWKTYIYQMNKWKTISYVNDQYNF